MAKKPQTPTQSDSQLRQSRKEQLIARKHEQQVRNLRIAGVVVLVLIAIVIAVALVNELFLTPDRPVATVGDQTIALHDWQERVTYERAQRIIFLENQLEAFGGDVGIVQQFGGSVINELLDPEGLGENVLNVMAEELVICDAVAERGLEISDADVQDEINVNFGFFGDGVSPTGTPPPETLNTSAMLSLLLSCPVGMDRLVPMTSSSAITFSTFSPSPSGSSSSLMTLPPNCWTMPTSPPNASSWFSRKMMRWARS